MELVLVLVLATNPCVMMAGRSRPVIRGETHMTAAPLGQASHLWQLEIQISAKEAIEAGALDDDDDDDDGGFNGSALCMFTGCEKIEWAASTTITALGA